MKDMRDGMKDGMKDGGVVGVATLREAVDETVGRVGVEAVCSWRSLKPVAFKFDYWLVAALAHDVARME